MAKAQINPLVDAVTHPKQTLEEYRHAWLRNELCAYIDSITFDDNGSWVTDDMPKTHLKDKQIQWLLGRAMNLVELLHHQQIENDYAER